MRLLPSGKSDNREASVSKKKKAASEKKLALKPANGGDLGFEAAIWGSRRRFGQQPTKLRDTLLPKLMSGEIRIRGDGIEVEAVA